MKNIKVIWLFKVWKFSIEIKLSNFAHMHFLEQNKISYLH